MDLPEIAHGAKDRCQGAVRRKQSQRNHPIDYQATMRPASIHGKNGQTGNRPQGALYSNDAAPLALAGHPDLGFGEPCPCLPTFNNPEERPCERQLVATHDLPGPTGQWQEPAS